MTLLKGNVSPFLKNVIKLVSATGLAQVVQLIATPVLTRIFTPEEFSVYQLFYSAAAIVAVVATLRYELAIVLPREDSDARKLTSGSILISFFLALFCIVVLLACFLLGYFREAPFYFWLPLYIALAGISQSFNYWSIRKGTYNLNLTSRITTSVVQAGTGIALGMAGYTTFGLIIALFSGQIASSLILSRDYLQSPKSFSLKNGTARLRELLQEHVKFPKFNSPHALVDTLQDHGIVFVLSIYFEQSLIAFYGQAFRLLKAPVGFIGAALHQVFYPDFTRRYQSGENLQKTVKSFYLRLFLIGAPFFLVLGIFAIPFFRWFLGDEWVEVGHIVQLLTLWLFLNFIASPLSSMPLIAGRQGTAALLTFTELIFRIAAIIIGGKMANSTIAIGLISIFGTLFTTINIIWYYRLAKGHENHA